MPSFIDLEYLDVNELEEIIDAACALKLNPLNDKALGKHLAMIFEKESTRTRVSFEVGINQLGGNAVVLMADNTQISRGESIADTAKVLSRYVDLLVLRCAEHSMLIEMDANASIPIINGLTDYSHPCQVMADIMTYKEKFGSIRGKAVSWFGDGCNNVINSWIHAAVKFGFTLKISSPQEFKPNDIMQWACDNGGDVSYHEDPVSAAKGSDVITTDCWVSMGQVEVEKRCKLFQSYQVNSGLMSHAKRDCVFLHCLPVHRGEEVTLDVIDGGQSLVFDEAENRLHIQKAIMLWCFDLL